MLILKIMNIYIQNHQNYYLQNNFEDTMNNFWTIGWVKLKQTSKSSVYLSRIHFLYAEFGAIKLKFRYLEFSSIMAEKEKR